MITMNHFKLITTGLILILSQALGAQEYSLKVYGSFSNPIAFDEDNLKVLTEIDFKQQSCNLTLLNRGQVVSKTPVKACRELVQLDDNAGMILGKGVVQFIDRNGDVVQTVGAVSEEYYNRKDVQALKTSAATVAFNVPGKGLVEFDFSGNVKRILSNVTGLLYQLSDYQYGIHDGSALYLYLKSGNKRVTLNDKLLSFAVSSEGAVSVITEDSRDRNFKNTRIFNFYDKNLKKIATESWENDPEVNSISEGSQVLSLSDGGMALLSRTTKTLSGGWLGGWFGGGPNYVHFYKLYRFDRQGKKLAGLNFKESSISALEATENGDLIALYTLEAQPAKLVRFNSKLKAVWINRSNEIEYENELYQLPNSNFMTSRGMIFSSKDGSVLRAPVYRGSTDHAPIIFDSVRQIFMPYQNAIEEDGRSGAGWLLQFFYSF